MNLKVKVTLLFLLVSVFAASAQKKVINQNLYWMRYYNRLQINERYTWHNEAELRNFIDGNRIHHFIMHTRLHYRTGILTNVGAGITYSRQSPQDPVSASSLVVPEWRGVQEFNYRIPMNPKLSLEQRFRMEERFVRNNNGWELLEGSSFNFRFRFRLQANYRISSDDALKRMILKVSNETMINAGGTIVYNQFDQNRFYVGVERELNRTLAAEIGYMNWYQQTAAGDRFFNRNIIRITLFHRLTSADLPKLRSLGK